ncbi:hypothetical protein HPULCUR_005067 [Helicostylum pulchrum]|uniref:CRAL-TRIO domain-containing protein n=1 Tax=Helicostylum pulchrum TaxID=562976 RepID=A0ABP9XY13_9FUNG
MSSEQQKLDQLYGLLSESVIDKFSKNQLIQYLEANIWNVDDAKQQLVDTYEWRTKLDVDHLPVATKYNKLPPLVACRGYKHIQDTNFNVEPLLSESVVRIANCVGGDCFHKFDKEGHPILIDRTGYHNAKEMGNNVSTLEITNYQIATQEFLSRVLMPEGCEKAGKSIHSETAIFDCTNMKFHMGAFQHLRAIAEIVQHYYPETLHRLFVVNAPSAFVVMFKVIKPWLNPRTLDKIHVLGKDFESVLLEYVEAENLPDFLGGTCTCSHMSGGCVPMKSKFKPTDKNEKVPTVYNEEVMDSALSDRSLCGLLPSTTTTVKSVIKNTF